MTDKSVNPFNVTKADGFTDREINDLWVDISSGNGFWKLAKLTSPTPMYILGSKGSGKTHLMKYFSYPVQKIRHSTGVLAGIREDGYLGVYFKCGGLNASRFEGKGQTEEAWGCVFAYSMDLWIAEHLVATVRDLLVGSDDTGSAERAACAEIADLFDNTSSPVPEDFSALHRRVRDLQRELDAAINNCAVAGTLSPNICATRGRLVFGIPTALACHFPTLRSLRILYLIDEFENLSSFQQKYVNTLVRERQEPVSFKIGARLYGVRTYSTYCADEDNKEGSEHETLRLDAWLRGVEPKYATFSRHLVIRRLADHDKIRLPTATDQDVKQAIASHFESPPNTRLAKKETTFIVAKYRGRERPYFEALRRKLELGLRSESAPGIAVSSEIDSIIALLRVDEFPLLEKVNAFLLYKAWASEQDIRVAAARIADECREYMANPHLRQGYWRRLHHFRADFLAQLRRECGGGRRQRESYTGINTLISMSWGVPRHLLILLKGAFAWATFNGEQPFSGSTLSVKAQEAGVSAAAKWFLSDAAMAGRDGQQVQDGIMRLAELFREIRYSDKPSECSVVAFSYDETRVSPESRRIIQHAVNWSLLVEVGKQRDRNSLRVDRKLQLNRMLAPLWDLPIFRRGVLALSTDEVDAIFDSSHVNDFEKIKEGRVSRMTAPFFGRKPTETRATKKPGPLLPGFEDE